MKKLVSDYRCNGLFLSVCLVASAMSGCGGSSGGGGADAVAAGVTVTPEDGAVGVERNIVLSAAFGKDMLATTFDNASFTLSDGNKVAGEVAFDALSNVATLTPTTDLDILRNYSATLTSGITNLSGDPIAAQQWSFTTRDGVWGAAGLLETDDTNAASYPKLGFDASGNAIFVWLQNNTVWSKRYNAADGTWAETMMIDNHSGVSQLQMAVHADGQAIVVWSQNDGGIQSIRAVKYDPDTTLWEASVLIESGAAPSWNPQIAFDSSGDAIAVWEQQAGGVDSIWANRYTDGAGWGVASVIENKSEPALAPQIAIDSSGNALAVWVQTDGGIDSIWANAYNPVDGWDAASASEIESNAGTALTPQIAFDSSDNAIVVWEQPFDGYDSIWANRYVNDVGWSTAAVIADGIGDAIDPQVAFDRSGNAIAVWSQNLNMMSNRYSAGVGWGTPESLEENVGAAAFPRLAIDRSGNAIAVWRQPSGGFNSIWVNRYSATAGWGTAAVIETSDELAATPEIAIDNSGNAFVVWEQIDNGINSVFASRFD